MATVAKCQFDVEFSGGVYVNEGCVVSGNMVSGRTWHDQHLYMPVFMRMIEGQCQSTVITSPR
jgi:protease I